MKKRFLLQATNPDTDCDFLNMTSISFSFIGAYGPGDSGFCDWATGARIVSPSDKIIFVSEDTKDETVLRLAFGDRLQELGVLDYME